MCGNITKTIKNISRTHCNFLGIFARNFSMHRGPDSKNKGAYSKKIQETERKPKNTTIPGPHPRGWWIRISRMPQRRWIDPDAPTHDLTT